MIEYLEISTPFISMYLIECVLCLCDPRVQVPGPLSSTSSWTNLQLCVCFGNQRAAKVPRGWPAPPRNQPPLEKVSLPPAALALNPQPSTLTTLARAALLETHLSLVLIIYLFIFCFIDFFYISSYVHGFSILVYNFLLYIDGLIFLLYFILNAELYMWNDSTKSLYIYYFFNLFLFNILKKIY